MSKLARLVCAVLITLTILVIALGTAAAWRYETYTSGLWAGDATFMHQAGLNDFQLFLAPLADGRRQGYLIMVDSAGKFIANQAFELREGGGGVRRWWSALRAGLATEQDTFSVRDVELVFDDAAHAPSIPAPLRMAVSMLDGTLTLYDGTSVYAFLEKDLTASAAAIAAFAEKADA